MSNQEDLKCYGFHISYQAEGFKIEDYVRVGLNSHFSINFAFQEGENE